jgi:hypothetical protein
MPFIADDQVGRHIDVGLLRVGRARVLDLGLDHALERVRVLAVRTRLLEGEVQVRSHRPVRARPRQRVAAAALLGEELLALVEVGLRAQVAAGQADDGRGRDDRGDRPDRPALVPEAVHERGNPIWRR